MRSKLGTAITNRPQFPDVVGDRKLLRFLKGHGNDVDKAVEMALNFFKWRDTNGVDEIREKIIYGGLDHPLKFPNGEKVTIFYHLTKSNSLFHLF